jgi:hypothetical protein
MSLLPLVTGLLDLGLYVQCPTNPQILLANLGRGARPRRKCAMRRIDRMGGNPCWPYQEIGKPLGLSVVGRSAA